MATPEFCGEEDLKDTQLKTLAMFHKQLPEAVQKEWVDGFIDKCFEEKYMGKYPCIALAQTYAQKK